MFGKAQFFDRAVTLLNPLLKRKTSMLLKHLINAAALAAVCMMVSPVVGQTADLAGSTTTISVDGTLVGFVRTATSDVVTNAKVSLVSQGKVIDSAVSDESGNFSFANVNPGPYQIVGSSDGMVGAQAYHVGPYVESASAAPANVILQTSAQESVYDAVGSAPLAAYGGCSACAAAAPSPCSTCNTCNTCGGGGFGGGGLGLGRGFLTSPRGLLLTGGLIGGLAAIDDDDDQDDASPDL